MHEAYDALNVLGTLGIPLIPKLNVLVSVDTAYQIYQHKDCDALCVSNTIPYGRLTESIDWQKYFGKESPLKKYGGGGLSGKPLFPLLVSWLQRAEAAWQGKNVNVLAGGGILCAEQVERLREFSIVRAVSPGSVAFLRWWRLHSIIKKAHACFW